MFTQKYGKSGSYSSVKKIKHFSYNPIDSIGKGFSSVVYRGQNDNTSKSISCMLAHAIPTSSLTYPRINCCHQGHRYAGYPRFCRTGDARLRNLGHYHS